MAGSALGGMEGAELEMVGAGGVSCACIGGQRPRNMARTNDRTATKDFMWGESRGFGAKGKHDAFDFHERGKTSRSPFGQWLFFRPKSKPLNGNV
jgi:hypothetical protein